MIEKTLKTTTGRIKIKIPSSLHELTLGQLIEIQDKPELNDLEAIGILSGIAVEQLQNVKNYDDLQQFGETVLLLSTQIAWLFNSGDVPRKITFNLTRGANTVNVMRNLSIEPAGAFMAAREIIGDEINHHIERFGHDDWQDNFKPSLKACCQVLAHYFYCRATGEKYNEYEAEEFCTEIKKLRVTEALPIAKHFFTCYPSLSKPKTGYSLRPRQFWKKRQGSSVLKNSNISIP
ncbi:hypothetical protein [Mucilaginibacter sp.]|uniref:hypothetical protein n=1 Tax=Mucilaginibacter sp. TaxID=1882438 RepID=UPI00284C1171|nr:hypothetical protein [Mucilaginibacter sp.]MDR3693385.1 hypothetical protein [Mucilaginibacter sp.]